MDSVSPAFTNFRLFCPQISVFPSLLFSLFLACRFYYQCISFFSSPFSLYSCFCDVFFFFSVSIYELLCMFRFLTSFHFLSPLSSSSNYSIFHFDFISLYFLFFAVASFLLLFLLHFPCLHLPHALVFMVYCISSSSMYKLLCMLPFPRFPSLSIAFIFLIQLFFFLLLLLLTCSALPRLALSP